MIGTIEPRKNTLRVLEAYERLVGTADVPPLVLAGRRAGWGQNWRLHLLAQTCVVVHTLGCLNERTIGSFGWRRDAALPSCRGFGLPVLEGMAVCL